MRQMLLFVALLGALLACKRFTGQDPSSDERPAPGGTVTIRVDSDGKTKVEGAGKLSGAPQDCRAFRVCCSQPDMGLACGLIEAAGGTCTEALESARAMIRERGLTPPAGCL